MLHICKYKYICACVFKLYTRISVMVICVMDVCRCAVLECGFWKCNVCHISFFFLLFVFLKQGKKTIKRNHIWLRKLISFQCAYLHNFRKKFNKNFKGGFKWVFYRGTWWQFDRQINTLYVRLSADVTDKGHCGNIYYIC